MKKLISLSLSLLLVTVSIISANPLPLLPMFGGGSLMLGLNSAIDVSQLTTYAEKNEMGIISSLINGLDIKNDVMVHPGVKNKIPMTKLKVGNGLRPFSSTVEWKVGDAGYTNRFLETKLAKRELFLNAADYQSTYLAWLMEAGSDSKKRSLPYEQHFWDQVAKSIAREVNDEIAYKGFDKTGVAVFNAGTVYNAGNKILFATTTNNPNAVKDYYVCKATTVAGESPDTTPVKWEYASARAVAIGFEQRILDGIGASEIAPISTGAITATPGVALAAFKELFRAFNASYRNNGILISCSITDFDLLLDDLGEKYKGIREDASANGYLTLPESNRKGIIKPATWLGSSRRLIAGPVFMAGGNPKHMNLIMATDVENDINGIETLPKENRSFWAGVNFAIGFNYQDSEAIKVGDQS